MNNKLPISLAFFTSTKGHFDIKDRYQTTLKSLSEAIPLDSFGQLIAHIKGDDKEAENPEIEKILSDYGFQIHKSVAPWKHEDLSCHSEYLKDITKISRLANQEYFFHMEDDWLFSINKENLRYYLERAMHILRNNLNYTCVRIVRHKHEIERIGGMMEKHGINSKVFLQNEEIFTHSDLHSFNPNLMRTRDVFLACNFIERFKSGFSANCEIAFSQILKTFSNAEDYEVCFQPDLIRALHIGTRRFEEDI